MNSKFNLPLLLLIFSMSGFILSCSENESGEKPFISYIRITNPASSDSLLVSAGQGQMIAIMGGGLQTVQQVWFNDQKATVLPTFVTNSTIITRVPSQLPGDINNKLKLKFANGDSLLYNFSVDISKPLIDHVRSEYVNAGDSLFIYGSYFYAPLTVTFTGGSSATILAVSQDGKSITAKMPAGVQPGPITVTTNFGSKSSVFWMQDNRNIIASFDIPLVNNIWHAEGVVSSDPTIGNISGKFLRVNKGALPAYPYLEVYEGTQGSDLSIETKNIPAEAFSAASNYSVKFEINTLASLTGANMWFYLGDDNGCCGGDFGAARNNIHYVWLPNVNTQGVWQTVSIPWADVYADNLQFAPSGSGYGMGLIFHGPNAVTYNLAIDNIRVVPNK